jgi:glutamate mutase epsilon subunit
MTRVFNVSTKKVGGIRFFKLGRINLSFSVSRVHHEAIDRRAKRSARPVTTMPDGFDLEAEVRAIVEHEEKETWQITR